MEFMLLSFEDRFVASPRDQTSSGVTFLGQNIYLTQEKGKLFLYRNQNKHGMRKKLAALAKTRLL